MGKAYKPKKQKGLRDAPLSEAQEKVYKHIVQTVASEQGASVKEVLQDHRGRKPRFLEALERRARIAGKSATEILADDWRQLQSSSYPGPKCLTPDEIDSFHSSGDVPRGDHLNECEWCSALIRATEVDAAKMEQLLETVRYSAYAVEDESRRSPSR